MRFFHRYPWLLSVAGRIKPTDASWSTSGQTAAASFSIAWHTLARENNIWHVLESSQSWLNWVCFSHRWLKDADWHLNCYCWSVTKLGKWQPGITITCSHSLQAETCAISCNSSLQFVYSLWFIKSSIDMNKVDLLWESTVRLLCKLVVNLCRFNSCM